MVLCFVLCFTSVLLGSFGEIPAISFDLWANRLSYCFDYL